jgi:hypothetical protein
MFEVLFVFIRLSNLRMQMNKGVRYIDVSDFNWENVHAIVSLLKCFLNELPDSIITTGQCVRAIFILSFLF